MKIAIELGNNFFSMLIIDFPPFFYIVDSCLVKNGGCDTNAVCSHHSKTNAVKCTCKTGYTNTGSESNVVCTGKTTNKLKVEAC